MSVESGASLRAAAAGTSGGCRPLDEAFWCRSKRAASRFLGAAATTVVSSCSVLPAVTVARLLDPTICLPASLISARCRTRISRVRMTSSVSAMPPILDYGNPQSACAHRTHKMFWITSRSCNIFLELSTISTHACARRLCFRVANAWQHALVNPHFIPGPPARASSANVRRTAAKAGVVAGSWRRLPVTPPARVSLRTLLQRDQLCLASHSVSDSGRPRGQPAIRTA